MTLLTLLIKAKYPEQLKPMRQTFSLSSRHYWIQFDISLENTNNQNCSATYLRILHNRSNQPNQSNHSNPLILKWRTHAIRLTLIIFSVIYPVKY